MDPLSIATACIGLIGSITNLSKLISLFVSEVRGARKDLDAVDRELKSLHLCLQLLHDDSTTMAYSEGVLKNLLEILKNCDLITSQMKVILNQLRSGNILRRIQWSIDSSAKMSKLRSSLEAHKTALDIALTVGQVQIMNSIWQNTIVTRTRVAAMNYDKDTLEQISLRMESHLKISAEIQQDTSLIGDLALEISHLQSQLAAMPAYGLSSTLRGLVKEALISVNPFVPDAEMVHLETLNNPFSDPVDMQPPRDTDECTNASPGATPPSSSSDRFRETLGTQIESLEQKLTEKDQKINELETDLDSAKHQLQHHTGGRYDRYGHYHESPRALIESLERELAGKINKINELEAGLTTAREEIQRLKEVPGHIPSYSSYPSPLTQGVYQSPSYSRPKAPRKNGNQKSTFQRGGHMLIDSWVNSRAKVPPKTLGQTRPGTTDKFKAMLNLK